LRADHPPAPGHASGRAIASATWVAARAGIDAAAAITFGSSSIKRAWHTACSVRGAMSTSTSVTNEHPPRIVQPCLAGVATVEPPVAALVQIADVVSTPMRFACARHELWERLMFYEQLDQRPPLLLRWLLPVPIRTVGDKSRVGDEVRCLYEGGYLIKRITTVEPGRVYAFDVIEQALAVGGLQLGGGEYRLADGPAGDTVMTLSTRYASSRRPRWLWRPIEAAVCHAFHRHILRAVRRSVEAR
jgi:hypothetical protein